MLYSINGKCYVNIAPSVYIEVIVMPNGDIKSTLNKIEINKNTVVTETTVDNEIKKIKVKKETIDTKPSPKQYEMNRRYNKRKK